MGGAEQLALCLVQSSQKLNTFPHGASRVVSMICDLGSALPERLR